jgi:HPt (histidine-containing phosphotransfer) domain-containing protein
MSKKVQDNFDISYLKTISNNDQKFIKEVLRLFIETTNEAIQKLKLDLEKKDFKSIEFLLHRMRSSIMPFNLTKLNEQLKKTEQSIGESIYSNVDEEVGAIVTDTSRIVKLAQKELLNIKN